MARKDRTRKGRSANLIPITLGVATIGSQQLDQDHLERETNDAAQLQSGSSHRSVPTGVTTSFNEAQGGMTTTTTVEDTEVKWMTPVCIASTTLCGGLIMTASVCHFCKVCQKGEKYPQLSCRNAEGDCGYICLKHNCPCQEQLQKHCPCSGNNKPSVVPEVVNNAVTKVAPDVVQPSDTKPPEQGDSTSGGEDSGKGSIAVSGGGSGDDSGGGSTSASYQPLAVNRDDLDKSEKPGVFIHTCPSKEPGENVGLGFWATSKVVKGDQIHYYPAAVTLNDDASRKKVYPLYLEAAMARALQENIKRVVILKPADLGVIRHMKESTSSVEIYDCKYFASANDPSGDDPVKNYRKAMFELITSSLNGNEAVFAASFKHCRKIELNPSERAFNDVWLCSRLKNDKAKGLCEQGTILQETLDEEIEEAVRLRDLDFLLQFRDVEDKEAWILKVQPEIYQGIELKGAAYRFGQLFGSLPKVPGEPTWDELKMIRYVPMIMTAGDKSKHMAEMLFCRWLYRENATAFGMLFNQVDGEYYIKEDTYSRITALTNQALLTKDPVVEVKKSVTEEVVCMLYQSLLKYNETATGMSVIKLDDTYRMAQKSMIVTLCGAGMTEVNVQTKLPKSLWNRRRKVALPLNDTNGKPTVQDTMHGYVYDEAKLAPLHDDMFLGTDVYVTASIKEVDREKLDDTTGNKIWENLHSVKRVMDEASADLSKGDVFNETQLCKIYDELKKVFVGFTWYNRGPMYKVTLNTHQTGLEERAFYVSVETKNPFSTPAVLANYLVNENFKCLVQIHENEFARIKDDGDTEYKPDAKLPVASVVVGNSLFMNDLKKDEALQLEVCDVTVMREVDIKKTNTTTNPMKVIFAIHGTTAVIKGEGDGGRQFCDWLESVTKDILEENIRSPSEKIRSLADLRPLLRLANIADNWTKSSKTKSLIPDQEYTYTSTFIEQLKSQYAKEKQKKADSKPKDQKSEDPKSEDLFHPKRGNESWIESAVRGISLLRIPDNFELNSNVKVPAVPAEYSDRDACQKYFNMQASAAAA